MQGDVTRFSRELLQGTKEAAAFAEGKRTGARVHAVIARHESNSLTRDFGELVQKRLTRDPAFGDALLRQAIDTMLAGDVDTGKAILRDCIKATIGFEKLGEATGTPAKSLVRMLGPRGNPQARKVFGIIGYLQRQLGVQLHVAAGQD